MTENEIKEATIEDAIYCAKAMACIEVCEECRFYRLCHTWCDDVYRLIVDALEEIKQYRAIGTAEEFKALKEKNTPKKPILNNPKIDEFYVKEAKLCPACHSYINNCSGDYCRDCGQKLDWSE